MALGIDPRAIAMLRKQIASGGTSYFDGEEGSADINSVHVWWEYTGSRSEPLLPARQEELRPNAVLVAPWG